jgi:HK97 family phage major capsid protein
MPTLKELYESRKAIHNQAVQYLAAERFDTEKRGNFEKCMVDVEALTVQIKAAEARGGDTGAYVKRSINAKHEAAFGRWLRNRDLDDAERRSLELRDGMVEGAPMLNHIGSYNGLGFFVPTGFSNQIETATKYYAPLTDGSSFKVWETATGNPIPWPTNNDTGNVSAVVGEAGTFNEVDITASQINFGAYKFGVGPLKVSLELLQDSAFNLEAYLSDLAGIRFGRQFEQKLTNGTGVGEPTGILTAIEASGAVPVIATGSAETTGGTQTGVNSIGYSDLVNLEHVLRFNFERFEADH